jgi:Cu+-exporting ATPase
MSIDPVCGMTVDPAKAAGHVEHKGTTYHFCSQHCVHAFKADPEKFCREGETRSSASAD